MSYLFVMARNIKFFYRQLFNRKIAMHQLNGGNIKEKQAKRNGCEHMHEHNLQLLYIAI